MAGDEVMKSIYKVAGIIVAMVLVIATITFFILGGNSQGQVSQEKVPAIAPTIVAENSATKEPVTVPTIPAQEGCVLQGNITRCSYSYVIHPVNSATIPVEQVDRPVLHPRIGTVDWKETKLTLSKENLAFWLGRNNTAWKEGSREEIYQKVFSYVREYRHGVKIESAQFDKIIASKDSMIYQMENVFVGGNYMDEGIRAYATTFVNPNDEKKEVELVFFYDKEDDLIACGYGDHKAIITKRNFVLGGDSGGGSDGSGSGGSGGDSGGSNSGGDSGGPEGGVPS